MTPSVAPPPGSIAGASPRRRAPTPPEAPRSPASSGFRPGRLGLCLLLLWLVEAGLLLGPGRMSITTLEVDALHFFDGVARVALGQRAHVDFHTPIGALAFGALSVWDQPMWRQAALASLAAGALTLPLSIWLGATRLRFPLALAAGVLALLLAVSLSPTPATDGATTGLIYNRWGWAAFLPASLLLALPPRGDAVSPRLLDLGDGLALGLSAALIAFVKPSFVAALLPAFLGWVLLFRHGRAAAWTAAFALAGMVVIALVQTGGGSEIDIGGALVDRSLRAAQDFAFYLGDLRHVALSDTRASPGLPLPRVLSTPQAAPITLAAVLGAVALARGGLGREAALFALVALGAVFAAWQNWGNHLTGALAWPILLLALRPRLSPQALVLGLPARGVAAGLAVALAFWAASGALTLQRSLLYAWSARPEAQELFPGPLPGLTWPADESGLKGLRPIDPESDRLALDVAGARVPGCKVSGHALSMREAADALRGHPGLLDLAPRAADVTDGLWLVAGTPPPAGGAIWLYAREDAAAAQAGLLAVPLCAVRPEARNAVLRRVEEEGLRLEEAARARNWIFYRILP